MHLTKTDATQSEIEHYLNIRVSSELDNKPFTFWQHHEESLQSWAKLLKCISAWAHHLFLLNVCSPQQGLSPMGNDSALDLRNWTELCSFMITFCWQFMNAAKWLCSRKVSWMNRVVENWRSSLLWRRYIHQEQDGERLIIELMITKHIVNSRKLCRWKVITGMNVRYLH